MSADKFAPRSPADTSRLVRGHPLAWVVSVATGEPRATLLPMLPVEVDGRLERLMGHFARSNPQVQLLQAQPRALILFRSEEHTSELQSPCNLVCRLLLEKKKNECSLPCLQRP